MIMGCSSLTADWKRQCEHPNYAQFWKEATAASPSTTRAFLKHKSSGCE
jgi:hypothetical protein